MDHYTNDVFDKWIGKSIHEIDKVRRILSERLSDEPEQLIRDLEAAEVWNARMGYLLAEANSWLDRGRASNMPDKEGKTEFERKIILDDSVTEIRRYRDIIESVCDSIKQRLILGESILSYFKQFNDRKGSSHEYVKPWGETSTGVKMTESPY